MSSPARARRQHTFGRPRRPPTRLPLTPTPPLSLSPPPPPQTLPGWLTLFDPVKQRWRKEYVVLTPQYLSLYTNEAFAAISEEGFMQGVADVPDPRAAVPPSPEIGVQIPLKYIERADTSAPGNRFSWVLTQPIRLSHFSEAELLSIASTRAAVGISETAVLGGDAGSSAAAGVTTGGASNEATAKPDAVVGSASGGSSAPSSGDGQVRADVAAQSGVAVEAVATAADGGDAEDTEAAAEARAKKARKSVKALRRIVEDRDVEALPDALASALALGTAVTETEEYAAAVELHEKIKRKAARKAAEAAAAAAVEGGGEATSALDTSIATVDTVETATTAVAADAPAAGDSGAAAGAPPSVRPPPPTSSDPLPLGPPSGPPPALSRETSTSSIASSSMFVPPPGCVLLLQLEAPNREIVEGWCGALIAQVARWDRVDPPPRLLAPKPPPRAAGPPSAVTVAVARSSRALVSAVSTAASGTSSFFSGVLKSINASADRMAAEQATKDAIAHAINFRPDADYVAYSFWESKGLDLTLARMSSALLDEHNHHAALLHGWLTKRNKSGVASALSAVIEKERYFVLTPVALCFFLDDKHADVRDGYLYGLTGGKSIAGILKKTGGALPLETVCEVRLLANLDQARKSVSAQAQASEKHLSNVAGAVNLVLPPTHTPGGAALSLLEGERIRLGLLEKALADCKLHIAELEARGDIEEDDRDEDDDEFLSRPKPPRGHASLPPRPPPASTEKPVGPRPPRPGGAPGEAASGGSPRQAAPTGDAEGVSVAAAPDAPSASAVAAAVPAAGARTAQILIEVDFGDFSLIINAHNKENRSAWVGALRKWSGIRKQQIDEQLFTSFSGGQEH